MPHWTFKTAGIINTLYVLAGIALFATGTAPVIAPETDFLGDEFAVAWAGWKFTGCLFFAMTNLGVDLAVSNSIAMVLYVAFDLLACQDTAHWTTLAYGFIILDGAVIVLMLLSALKPAEKRTTCPYTFASILNFLYVLAGCALFATGTAPVVTPETDFLGDKFIMAWAGWKFAGCLYFALVNYGVQLHLCNAISMLIYVGFDIFAALDPTHWTPLAFGFIVLDGIVGLSSLLLAPKGVYLTPQISEARSYAEMV